MRALSDLFTLLKLNLLTLLCCLPLVTAGAALTALHYCLLKMLDQEEGKILPMYFGQFKGITLHSPLKKTAQSCPALCNSMDCACQAALCVESFRSRVVEWVALKTKYSYFPGVGVGGGGRFVRFKMTFAA